ncbi:Hypothetical predicted protein [Mytilus galloprovincialis]|uniref:Uncharacterized protein n=4 Tax=Mytilus galloprovincialis TaxID=29158 RepID=A0A8B6GFU9_MYTGA|nr:Hypothetical predicted protein [Mytilus galloprovincialis]
MRNMTWIPAYNDTGSAEYQIMLQTVNQMEANLRQQMLSMDSSPSMSDTSPIAEILYRLVFTGARPLNTNVEIMFNLEFKGRYAKKSDGSQMMLDWLTIKDILSAGLKIDRDDCIITDLTPMSTTTTAVNDSTTNTTTATLKTTSSQPHNMSSTTKAGNFVTPTTTALPNTTHRQSHNMSSTTKSGNFSPTALPNTTHWQPHNMSSTTKSGNFSPTALPNTTHCNHITCPQQQIWQLFTNSIAKHKHWQPHNMSTTTKSGNFSPTALPNTTHWQPHNMSTTTKSGNFSPTALPNTTHWQPHNISTTTSSSVPNGTVIFFVQLRMINMSWTPAYNDTGSPEYQMLMLEIQQMEVKMQQYMSSMDNSTTSSRSLSSSMPVSQIYEGFHFHKISEFHGNVMIMFNLVFRARYAMMSDGSMMTMDTNMVANILSDVVHVDPSQMHIKDLMSEPESTTHPSAGGNTTTMAPPSNTTIQSAVCIEATSDYHNYFCKPFGFNLTSYPNFAGHQSEAEASEIASLLLNYLINCTVNSSHVPVYMLMCSVLTPSCEGGRVIPPCSELCYDVAMTCGSQNIPGLEGLLERCGSFPSYNSGQQCIHYLDRIPSTPVPTISNTTTPSNGNVSCDEDHFASYGWVESPNYPNNYPNSVTCNYRIQSPYWLPITLQFVDFEVEAQSGSSCYDNVTIYDGSSSDGRQLASYCGSSIPNPVTAPSGQMFIVFFSDVVVPKRGFQAVFSDASIQTNMTTPWTPTNTTPGSDICIEATSPYHNSICKPFGFNLTSYPNYLGHQSEAEAAQIAMLLLSSTNINCTADVPEYVMMCAVLTPSCEGGRVIPPCLEPCMNVAYDCGLQNIPGLENITQLCSSFPSYYSGQQCIHYFDLTSTTPVPTASNTTTPSNVSCDESYIGSYGWIESPNYPNNYPNSVTCNYFIMSRRLLPLTLHFVDFEVEASSSGCNYDHVTIYDGASSNGTQLARYCGSFIPNPVTASSGLMFIEFYSDYVVPKRGFQAVFQDASIQTNFTTPWRPTGHTNYTTPWTPTTTSPGACGGYFTGLTGILASPNYPGNYPNSQRCYYFITAPIGYTVVLTFTHFYTENCCDHVDVFDGLTNSDLLLVTLRGVVSGQRVVQSTSNKMMVYFYTDGSVVYNGFRAIYTTNMEHCPIDHVQCSMSASDCVSVYKLCNGYPDCANGFDEQHCLNYTTLTSTQSTPSANATTITTTLLPHSATYTTRIPTTPVASNIELRLVNGSNCLEGRVEIKINGVWGTISTYNAPFTTREASVICRVLGFSGEGAIPYQYGYFGQADSTVPVWYTYLYCTGSESRLEQCSKQKYAVLSHAYDVGVRCQAGISEYYCSFNSDCMFLSASSSSSVHWLRRSGCTPSTATGPCTGHDGRSSSYYIFLETSGGSTGMTASLNTNVTFDSTPRCLSFYYHMYGSTINELQVKVRSSTDWSGTVVWSKKYDQGNIWHSASIDIQAVSSLQIQFSGIKGSSFTGDIALDEIKLYEGNM